MAIYLRREEVLLPNDRRGIKPKGNVDRTNKQSAKRGHHQMPLEMNKLLGHAASALCGALEEILPSLSETWWETCVQSKLSFQQRRHVKQRRISRLDQLDLAALIRLVDQRR